jgi:hypothetical protein
MAMARIQRWLPLIAMTLGAIYVGTLIVENIIWGNYRGAAIVVILGIVGAIAGRLLRVR